MAKINNIHKYKKAKILVKDLQDISVTLTEGIEKLTKHKKYIPVQQILECMNDNKTLVDIHLNHQKKILESKGQENGSD